MYDTIDISTNKKFYDLSKLNKLVSYKELLYNSILLYYILYNKFNYNKTDTIIDKSKIGDKIILYNKQENKHIKLYEDIQNKLVNLEKQCNKNDLSILKKSIDNISTILNNNDTNVDKFNANIIEQNKSIIAYNNTVRQKEELNSNLSYLKNLINDLKENNNNNNNNSNNEIIDKYSKELITKKNQIDKLVLKIDELNNIIKNYIVSNNKYISENELLTRQLQNQKIHNDEITLKLKKYNNKLDNYQINKQKQKNINSESLNKIKKLESKLENLNNKIINTKNSELKKKLELQVEEIKTLLVNENSINVLENNELENINKQIKNLKLDIKDLNITKNNLLKSIEDLKTQQNTILLNKNEALYINNLNEEKSYLEENNKNMLSNLYENNLLVDIDLKLKEKLKLTEKLNLLTTNIAMFQSYYDNLININNNSNIIINNINNNIIKINNLTDVTEKNNLRIINTNLKNNLENNKQLLESRKEELINYLNNIPEKNDIILLVLNILDIETEINILNNLDYTNTNIKTKCEENIEKIKTISNTIEEHKKNYNMLKKNYDLQTKLLDKLENNNILEESDINTFKKIKSNLELDTLYNEKNDILYNINNKLYDAEKQIKYNVLDLNNENMNLKRKIEDLNYKYNNLKNTLFEENSDLQNKINNITEKLNNTTNNDTKISLEKQIQDLQFEKNNIINKINQNNEQKQNEYLELLNNQKQEDLREDKTKLQEELNKKNNIIKKLQDDLNKTNKDLNKNTNVSTNPMEPSKTDATTSPMEPVSNDATTSSMEPSKTDATTSPNASSLFEPSKTDATTSPIEPAKNDATTSPMEPSKTDATTSPIEPAKNDATTSPIEPSKTDATTSPIEPASNDATTSPIEPSKTDATTSPMEPSKTDATTSPIEPTKNDATTSPMEPSKTDATTSPMEPLSNDATTSPMEPSKTDATTSPMEPSKTDATTSPTMDSLTVNEFNNLSSTSDEQEELVEEALQNEAPIKEPIEIQQEQPVKENDEQLNNIKMQIVNKLAKENPEIYNNEELVNLNNYLDTLSTPEELQSFIDGTYTNNTNNDFNLKLEILDNNLKSIANELEKLNLNTFTLSKLVNPSLSKSLTEEEIKYGELNMPKIKELVKLMYLWLYQHCKLRYILKNTDIYDNNNATRNQISLLTLFPMNTNCNSLDNYPDVNNSKLNRQVLLNYTQLLGYKNLNIKSVEPNKYTYKFYELLYAYNSKLEYMPDDDLNTLVKTFENEIKTNQNKSLNLSNVEFKYLGGSKLKIINNSVLNKYNNQNTKSIIDKINTKFNLLLVEYCINCSVEEKINKLNTLFNIKCNTEQELYDKYNITVRDLNLYLYLNLLDYIHSLNTKYEDILIKTIENIILEHINYTIWLLIFSKKYTYDNFTINLNKGKYNIDKIIEYVKNKINLQFNKNKYSKYYKHLLNIYILNIKSYKDYYNSKLKNVKINTLKSKYDNSYFLHFKNNNKSYESLINIRNIKNNIKINKTKYNIHILNLLNVVINIILYYKNLYLFVKNICNYFSINSLKTIKEINIILNNFKSYLNIDNFIKNNNIKSKRELNTKLEKLKYIKINKWQNIDLKLTNMNLYNDLEIECIKLKTAIQYNKNLLYTTNQFIKLYNIHRSNLFKVLNKNKINYKNITKHNKNILQNTTFTSINFQIFTSFNNNIKYLI